MLSIKELEERHIKYKIKSYLPYIITIIIIIIFLIISNQIFISKSKKNMLQKDIQKSNVEKISKLNSIIKNKEVITKKELPKQIIKKEDKLKTKRVILSPSLNFMRRINTTVDVYSNNNTTNQVKSKKRIKKEIKKEVITEEVVIVPLVEEKKEEILPLKIEKKSSIKISVNKDQEDIQHVIKRFKVNNNPALSLFVAKKYYQLGDYHKSYNYALITNQLNNNIEASWIIFSKSLMKLDKKEMAINTLKKYIDDSHSPRAKILLDEIQSGKFK